MRLWFVSALLGLLAPALAPLLGGGYVATAAAALDDAPGRVDLSFDQVDVRALTALMGELTGRRFVVSEGVRGQITAVAPGVPRDAVIPVFQSMLASIGCALLAEDGLYRVVRLPEGSLELGSSEDAEGLRTQVFRLRHVGADEVRKLLEAHGSRRSMLGVIESANLVVVTERPAMLGRVEELILRIDQPGEARLAEVIELEFAEADATARQLNEAMRETQTRSSQLLGRLPPAPGTTAGEALAQPPVLVAAPHANRLILVGTQAQIDRLRQLIERMDVAAPSGRSRLNAVFLRFLSAESAARTLNALLERAAAGAGDASDLRRVAVEADTVNNALLVDALPTDFERVRSLLDQLDQPPEQVHMTVLIVELAEIDGWTLGSEWTALNLPGSHGETVVSGGTRFAPPRETARPMMDLLQAGLFPQGLTVGVGRGVRTDGDGNLRVGYPGILNLNAMREMGKLNVVSETSLEAQNNHEASVSIVDDIPVLKSTIVGGSGTARDVIQNIERMEVGVKLRMTPQIIPGGHVRVELNPSIEAISHDGGADGLTPTISKRSVHTTVTVPDGETIVIAGLTRTDLRRNTRRIPLLGSIPVLGWFFRYDTDRETKTNLLILVTPRIVGDRSVASAIVDEWRAKTGVTDAPATESPRSE